MSALVDGVTITMGGRQWQVPALTFGQLRRLAPQIDTLSTLGSRISVEQMDAVGDIILAALGRNYPDLTREALDDMIDMRNVGPIVKAVMGQAGLVASGEAAAGSQ